MGRKIIFSETQTKLELRLKHEIPVTAILNGDSK
jgi:hypothetical protein